MLVLVASSEAFLIKDPFKASKASSEGTLTNWEQIEEGALARAGSKLPKTVIRVAAAKPKPSAFIEAESSTESVSEVTLKAGECKACVEEHFDSDLLDQMLLAEDKAEHVCSFCALYAFGGIYTGKDVEVNPMAWSLLPQDKISIVSDHSFIASPARKNIWKDAAMDVAKGTLDLSKYLGHAKDEINVLPCVPSLNEEKCTVHTNAPSGSPMMLLEVQSKALITQKYNKVSSAVAALMPTAQAQIEAAKKDLTEAEKSGDKRSIAIATEALKMQESMISDVLSEQKGLRERVNLKVSAGSLLQDQRLDMEVESFAPMLHYSAQKAVELIKKSKNDASDTLFEAAKVAIMPAEGAASLHYDIHPELNKVFITKLDEQLHEAIAQVQETEIKEMAGSANADAVERAAGKVYKSMVKKPFVQGSLLETTQLRTEVSDLVRALSGYPDSLEAEDVPQNEVDVGAAKGYAPGDSNSLEGQLSTRVRAPNYGMPGFVAPEINYDEFAPSEETLNRIAEAERQATPGAEAIQALKNAMQHPFNKDGKTIQQEVSDRLEKALGKVLGDSFIEKASLVEQGGNKAKLDKYHAGINKLMQELADDDQAAEKSAASLVETQDKDGALRRAIEQELNELVSYDPLGSLWDDAKETRDEQAENVQSILNDIVKTVQ